MKGNGKRRIFMYFLGMFILTAGIAFSVKSDLGVAPVSAPPYTLTCVWGVEMGKATILFHFALVLLQICLLRKNFKIRYLLQIPVGIIFGYFTTFCNYLVGFLPTPHLLWVRILFLFVSIVLTAFGIFLYLPPDIMPLAGEGTMQVISDTFSIDFSKVKIAADCFFVAVSFLVCFIMLHRAGSVGIGTVFSAVFTGIVLSWITKMLSGRQKKWLERQ